MHNPSNATTDDSVHLPPDHRLTAPTPCRSRARCDSTARTPRSGRRLRPGRPAPGVLDVGDHDPPAPGGRTRAAATAARARTARPCCATPAQPKVNVLAGAVTSTSTPRPATCGWTTRHDGLAQVRISGGGRPPLTLLIADTPPPARSGSRTPPPGRCSSAGPDLVRTAAVAGPPLALTGDTAAATTWRCGRPPACAPSTWNGATVAGRADPVAAAWARRRSWPARRRSRCPTCSTATGATRAESPEAAARVRRLGLAGRRPDHDEQHHQAAGRAAGAHRRRLRLPPRRRLVSRPLHRRRAGDHASARLRRWRRRDAAGLAGRRLPRPARAGQRVAVAADRRHGDLHRAGRRAPTAPRALRDGAQRRRTTRTATSTTRRRRDAG